MRNGVGRFPLLEAHWWKNAKRILEADDRVVRRAKPEVIGTRAFVESTHLVTRSHIILTRIKGISSK